MAKESQSQLILRQEKLKMLQDHYHSFEHFMDDMMQEIGFTSSWMQKDIANYLQHGPTRLMIQSQRGEAKTTITAMYAVFFIIHNPKARVVIVSAGSKGASEVSTLIHRLIFNVDILDCLKPDRNNGDRTSTEAFDIHYNLKGIDKSPSVSCIGVTSNLQGKRADLVIVDDVESSKNSLTNEMREKLTESTREFSNWVTEDWGRIVYLGTPQSYNSVYNSLTTRGYDLRIWPGRFPNAEQLSNYGKYLAPSLGKKLKENPDLAIGGGIDGKEGQPTDPEVVNEKKLQAQKLDLGLSQFQLQFMLDTSMNNELMYPLKLNQLVVISGSGNNYYPITIQRGFDSKSLKQFEVNNFSFFMSEPHNISPETAPFEAVHMHVDPAGGGINGDETAYAVVGILNSNIYVLGIGGVKGGYDTSQLNELADIVAHFNPNTVAVEKNMGYGAFVKVWQPILYKKWKGGIEENYVHKRKEQRIIDTLEPIMGRGSLIFLEDIIDQDKEACEKYSKTNRLDYSLFYQIANITRNPNCLKHDDRVDALEGAVSKFIQSIAIDQDKKSEKIRLKEYQKWLEDPTGKLAYTGSRVKRKPNMLTKYRK